MTATVALTSASAFLVATLQIITPRHHPAHIMAAHLSSHGRGGAGNIKSAQSPTLSPSDLETPTLKKPVVTTGRGGTGNMAKNNDPNLTRQRQDVTA